MVQGKGKKVYEICLIRLWNDLLFSLINDDKVFLAPHPPFAADLLFMRHY